jgi:hypothetical protein
MKANDPGAATQYSHLLSRDRKSVTIIHAVPLNIRIQCNGIFLSLSVMVALRPSKSLMAERLLGTVADIQPDNRKIAYSALD